MALEQILTLSALSADCGTQTWIDETVYGGDELLRNQLAIYVIGYKKGLPDEEDEALVVTGNDNDPLTDVSWIVSDTTKDGWYSMPMYAIPIYSGAGNYTIGQVVHHAGALWECLQAVSGVPPDSDPDFWDQIPLSDPAVEAADNVQFSYQNEIVTCRGDKCYAKVVSAAANEGCCEGCSDAELKQTYERLDLLLNAVFSNCTQLKYAEAEEIVRNVTNICENSKCICS